MERLTERLCDGVVIRLIGEPSKYPDVEFNGRYIQNAVVRLAAYEDSGLTPEEVMELSKIVRCKDCKYHSHDEEYDNHWCNYQHGSFLVKRYGFCDRGEA